MLRGAAIGRWLRLRTVPQLARGGAAVARKAVVQLDFATTIPWLLAEPEPQ